MFFSHTIYYNWSKFALEKVILENKIRGKNTEKCDCYTQSDL